MLARHVPTAIVAEVIKIRSKNYLTSASLQHLRRIVLSGGQINDTMSAAEKTLDCLRQEKGCNYSYILGSMDRAKSLITIRKGSWKLQKKSSSMSVDQDEQITEEKICATNEDERTRYTHSLLKGLSVGKDQVLIAVAWSTKDGYEYHKKFPRVLGMDTTNGTNNEKRGLQKLVGKTMENKNVPVMEVFVPSEQGWVFQHIISEFLPSLLDVCALKKTSLVLTDQCNEEMVAVSNEIKNDGIFNTDTRLRICKWHKCTPCTSGEGQDNSLLVDLSKTICTVPMLDVLNEYNSQTNFMVCDVSTEEQVENGDREFLVRQRPTDFSQGESMDKNLIPKYVRTRHVLASYRLIGDRNFISFKCTCCTFYHKLVTCRHVFVLLNRPPTQIDLFPECHKAYEVFYGEEGEDDFTKWVDERTLLLESLGGIQYEDTLDAICINENQLETNVELFCGTVDSNPNRTVWTQSGWKHNGGKEIQDSDDFSVHVTRLKSGEKKQISAFSMNKKMFELICNLAVTDAQKKELASGLDALHCRMRSMAISESLESTNLRTDGEDCDESVDIDMLQSEVASTTKHGLRSFTAIAKQAKRIRIRAPYSPLKRQQKKKKDV